MIQIYADGALAYDSRLREPGKDYTLLGLSTTTTENKGGTATIVMPPGHPAYDLFVEHRTILEFYRDGVLRFRGRALYPTDDFIGRRTWTVEGEMCLLQDGTARPYLYQESPKAIFTAVIEEYNDQVDVFKRFRVGEITVTDSNDYIRLESNKAEQTLDIINKLLERCGGYITFSTAADGAREINWYADPGYRSDQVIEFSKNLLDLTRQGSSVDLATVIFPYGAADQDTGECVTIASVNDGMEYIVDPEALALRGWISKPVYWDDVTEPANLLRKAQEWLVEHRQVITSLSLTAVDLSLLDKDIDDFQLGDIIRVRSAPHLLDADFKLTSHMENWLNPGMSAVSLGKETSSLTRADVAGDGESRESLQKTTQQIKAEYQRNLSNAIEKAEKKLISLIQQTGDSIRMEVSEEYATNNDLEQKLSSSITQLADSITFEFTELYNVVNDNNENTQEQFAEIKSYIRMAGGTLEFGFSGNAITLTIENDMIAFRRNGVVFGWWNGSDFHTGNIVVEVNKRAQFGNFAFIPRSNGSLSLLKVK